MDLLSLPLEIVVSILKFVNPIQLIQIRKMNLMVDAYAKYGNLTRTPVVDLILHQHEPRIQISSVLLKEGESNLPCMPTPDGYRNALSNILPKISITGSFCIYLNLEIGDALLNIFGNNKTAFKKCSKFSCASVELTLSTEGAIRFMRLFPKLDTLFFSSTKSSHNFNNSEVLGNRRWSHIHINIEMEKPVKAVFAELDDRFLHEVVTNCNQFGLTVQHPTKTNFTIAGLLSMMQVILSRGSFNQRLSVGPVELGYIEHHQIEGLLANLPDAIVNVELALNATEVELFGDYYKVTFELDDNFRTPYLIFRIKNRNCELVDH